MTCAPKKVGPGGPKLFDADIDAPVSAVFWNIGYKNCEGTTVQVKATMFRKWEQLLTHLAGKCGCGQGVRALFTPQGHQLKSFEEIKPGADIVVVPSGYMFDKNRLPVRLVEKLHSK